MYVYQQTEPELWTVGYYSPTGEWHAESDHALNGGGDDENK